MGLLLRFITIALMIGFAYVSIKRALLGNKPPTTTGPQTLPVDDLIKCPHCGVYGVTGEPCASPECRTSKRRQPQS